MNVATITMDPAEAHSRLEHYRKALRRRADDEYEQVATAYAALATGTPLLSLSAVFRAAPRDEKGRPRLAIGRADRRELRYHRPSWRGFGRNAESFSTWVTGRGPEPRDAVVELTLEAPIARTDRKGDAWAEGWSLVPLVPPDVRGTRNLREHFTLWEVERWSDRPHTLEADRDPYLLQRISRDLYAVVGEWDLTDVERAVMLHRVDAS